jgi:Spy/CpxP family protein refolding chaperone
MNHLARTLAVLALTAAATGPARAQHDHPASPYAAHADREIKALSPEEIEGLLSGAGMGLAMAAELNGYPGPRHVLELAGELELSEEQQAAVQASFDAMSAEARALGERIVALERALDAAFAERTVTEESLAATLDEIAAARSRLRFAHLKAHLETTRLLTDHQLMLYRHARGYGGHH